MDIIRTVYYIHGAELMKLIFAVLYVSRTMGLTRSYKTEVFLHLYHVATDKVPAQNGDKFRSFYRQSTINRSSLKESTWHAIGQ